jgi:hypothetical protein
MKMKKVALLLFFSILISTSSIAQVAIFSAQDTIGLNESTYSASIKVNNFNQIVGAQFTLTWDSTVLAYDQVREFGANFSANDHFGTDEITSGVLRFAWFNGALTGIDLADSTTLFTVDFKVLGTGSRQTNIAFTDIPTAREVYDTTFEIISSQFTNGSLMIGAGPISSVKENPAELNLQSISPNPLTNQHPILNFYIKRTDTLTIRVVTMNGQELYQSNQKVLAGTQSIQLERSIFPSTGTYLLMIQSSDFLSTQKLIVQQ